MKFHLEKTPEGNRWVKCVVDRETEEIVKTPMPVGDALYLDPNDAEPGTDIMVMRGYPPPSPENTSSVPFEEFMEDLLEKMEKEPLPPFKPFVFYNRAGDILEIFLEKDPCIVRAAAKGTWCDLEVCIAVGEDEDPERERIIGVKIWGLKNKLLRAFPGERD